MKFVSLFFVYMETIFIFVFRFANHLKLQLSNKGFILALPDQKSVINNA